MKNILKYFVISFLLLIIASQPSHAEPPVPLNKMERGTDKGNPLPIMFPAKPCGSEQAREIPHLKYPYWLHFHDLNLNDEQKEALKEIENIIAKEFVRKRADEQIAEIELRELLDKNSVDVKAVEKKLKQIAAAKTEMQLLIIKSIEKMKEKLTPEQRLLFNKIRARTPQMQHPHKEALTNNKTKTPPYSTGE